MASLRKRIERDFAIPCYDPPNGSRIQVEGSTGADVPVHVSSTLLRHRPSSFEDALAYASGLTVAQWPSLPSSKRPRVREGTGDVQMTRQTADRAAETGGGAQKVAEAGLGVGGIEGKVEDEAGLGILGPLQMDTRPAGASAAAAERRRKSRWSGAAIEQRLMEPFTPRCRPVSGVLVVLPEGRGGSTKSVAQADGVKPNPDCCGTGCRADPGAVRTMLLSPEEAEELAGVRPHLLRCEVTLPLVVHAGGMDATRSAMRALVEHMEACLPPDEAIAWDETCCSITVRSLQLQATASGQHVVCKWQHDDDDIAQACLSQL